MMKYHSNLDTLAEHPAAEHAHSVYKAVSFHTGATLRTLFVKTVVYSARLSPT
jgi:hypothetical protein